MTKKIWMVVLALVAALFYTVVGPKIKTQNLSFDGSEIVPFILLGLYRFLTQDQVQMRSSLYISSSK